MLNYLKSVFQGGKPGIMGHNLLIREHLSV
jgi:hypothetical protein